MVSHIQKLRGLLSNFSLAKPRLENTCLCAIVRDEVVNPAGGIKDFLKSIVPYVECAIIIDTGSIDGTREILEEYAGKYDHLIIGDRKFKGFADARNHSLEIGKKLGTRYAFVLDADERLTKKDFKKLDTFVRQTNKNLYKFNFSHIHFNGQTTNSPACWEKRMFGFNLDPSFKNDIYEKICFNSGPGFCISPVSIKHFLPSNEGVCAKDKFYSGFSSSLYTYTNPLPIGEFNPIAQPEFSKWKEINPSRKYFR